MKEFVAVCMLSFFMIVGGYVMYTKGQDDMKKQINKYPSAMDVYAGKTTLQYTIVDGVKKDSVVVFK